VNEWRPDIALEHPFQEDFAVHLQSLQSGDFPTSDDLNRCLSSDVCNQQGMLIRFVPSTDAPVVNYESHIYCTGQISTREKNWHDIFNALVWMRFPALKAAMNAVHYKAMQETTIGRGKQRDALTLFDECGVIVVAHEYSHLQEISNRNWQDVFSGGPDEWESRYQIFITGHAMLEKFLMPYKAMTANALLVHIPEREFLLERKELRTNLDAILAKQILCARVCKTSGDLSPIPLMGIPGWWQVGDQDDAFYADVKVFRPAPKNFRASPVFSIN
jgi:hypothetical protein